MEIHAVDHGHRAALVFGRTRTVWQSCLAELFSRAVWQNKSDVNCSIIIGLMWRGLDWTIKYTARKGVKNTN